MPTYCLTTGAATDSTAATTWSGWNDYDTSMTGGAVWLQWHADATNTATTASTMICWHTWIAVGGAELTNIVPAPEVIAQRDAVWRREAAERQAERDKVREKAWKLLLSMLDKQQKDQLERDRFFDVVARNSRRRYRIHHGTHGNVRLLNDVGKEVTRYCAQPNNVPAEDAMLAQKLMLEHEEDQYLKVANATRIA